MIVSAPPRALKSTVSTSLVSMVMLRDVAEEPQPVAVGGQVDVLGDGCAVEAHRVAAGLALDRVAAVARIPDERVVARAHAAPGRCPCCRRSCRCRRRRAAVSAPAPPASVSSPGAAVDPRRDGVGEDAVGFVDAHDVVAGAGVDGDLRDVPAPDAEVGRAVVADVDLEDVGPAGLEAKRDPVARAGASDRQRAVPEPRVFEAAVPVAVRGLAASRDAAASAGPAAIPPPAATAVMATPGRQAAPAVLRACRWIERDSSCCMPLLVRLR